MINQDIKIAFWGNSDFSLFCLEEMKKKGITPDIIVTSVDKPVGRKMILTPTPTKKWAEDNSIEYITPKKLKDTDFIQKISQYNLFMVASYGKIIPKEIIDLPKYKILNIHPSLLPKYRGPSPLQEQILNDEKDIGVTLMLIDELVDHGAIIAQKKVELKGMVGFKDLEKILAKEGSELLSQTLSDWIQGKIEAIPQDDSQATFTKKIEKEDGLVDVISGNPRSNYLKVLAFEVWPEAYFLSRRSNKDIKVKIKSAIWKDGEMQILKVLPEGKKEMDYKSFLNGLK